MGKFKRKQVRRTEKKLKKAKDEAEKSEIHQERGKRNSKYDKQEQQQQQRHQNKPTKSKFKKYGKGKKDPDSDTEMEVVSVKESPQMEHGHYKQDGASSDFDQNSDEETQQTRKLVVEQNRKKKRSGGFQSMGLSHHVYTGVMRKGYKVPTPIQRKTIPLIMEGKDVVAMARTGSGKTAAFLIPLFEKLKTRSAKSGARAIIMSPTRELALQTLKFTKELGKFTGLRAAVILGGDRMEDQFSALHNNPDVIIATPGRFLHVLMEMELKLKSVEYIVFDEADRLFEMGFHEQLHEIIHQLPESRQTVLFSATLPKLLVEFAKAGLHDPVLIRLDVDTKLSEQLRLTFLQCRADDKTAILLGLLSNIVRPDEQTVIFVATKHHVEYLNMVLEKADIRCAYIYSSLDQSARKIAIAKFQYRKASVLIVTDLAARGIDIPLLDNVINYNFSAKPKLFVHRVGRVARAGRSGMAYSLVSPDEIACLMDLHLFLGRPLQTVPMETIPTDDSGLFGSVPQSLVDEQEEILRSWMETSTDLQNLKKVCGNAYKQYIRSRPAPSSESIKRCKQMGRDEMALGIHPVFGKVDKGTEEERSKLLNVMKSYKPNATIFEINSTTKSKAMDVMKQKRRFHGVVIDSNHKRLTNKMESAANKANTITSNTTVLDSSTADDVQKTFVTVIEPRRAHITDQSLVSVRMSKKDRRIQVRDEENYLNYKPADFQSEQGLSVGNASNFEQQANKAILDLTGDENTNMKNISSQLRWDRKRKKYVRTDVGQDPKAKKIRTESGAWISASYKSNAYKDWLSRNKMEDQEDGDSSDEDGGSRSHKMSVYGTSDRNKNNRWHTMAAKESTTEANKFGKTKKFGRRELKRPEEILKDRRKKAKQYAFQQKRMHSRQKRKSIIANKSKKSWK